MKVVHILKDLQFFLIMSRITKLMFISDEVAILVNGYSGFPRELGVSTVLELL